MKKTIILLLIHFTIALNVPAQNWWLTMNNDSTEGTFIDKRDERVYNWIRIGKQIWMAENLNATHFNNGDSIPNLIVDKKWKRIVKAACCDYANDPGESDIYGKLYNFYAAFDSRNLCPQGWHLPTSYEWMILVDNFGGFEIAGGSLKAPDSGYWSSPNLISNDVIHFNALPGGFRVLNGPFYYQGKVGVWWTNDICEKNLMSGTVYLYNDKLNVDFYCEYRMSGLSVRCIKD